MAATEEKPQVGKYLGFHHCEFLVGNALQAASFYVARFGFKRVAYRGLETGSREIATHVVQQGSIYFSFTSALNPGDEKLGAHLTKHGDGVIDVAFCVTDAKAIYDAAIAKGAVSVKEPEEVDGVVTATIRTYGDTNHTLVQKPKDYEGFLPGYAVVKSADPLENVTPSPALGFIDHVVGNQEDKRMEPTAKWYEDKLEFHRFWSVDDSMIHTEYSSLRSIVMTDADEAVKMPINEPADGKRKSQIQEYVDYYGGPGVQHIALNTPDIIHAVTQLRARGVSFLEVPDTYYEDLFKKLEKAPISVQEDLKILQKLKILIDYDDKGYLLQLFTKPLEDRPTLFIEIIQRRNHQGFGAGNFKSLFEAIEREQEKRGNL